MAENADFVDYVDGIARAEEAAQRRQDMFAAHEVRTDTYIPVDRISSYSPSIVCCTFTTLSN